MIQIKNVLLNIHGFSRYQKVLLLLFCIINILSAVHYYSQTIISFVPDFWCNDGNYEISNELISSMRGRESSCYSSIDGANETCKEFVYDYYMGYKSLTSELNWVCEASWKMTLGQSMFFVGSVVGTFGFGILADIFGRMPILIISNLTAMTGNMLSIFTYSVTSFCIFRFISGLATDTNFVMMYILVMEYISPEFRTLGISICIGIFYCLGSMAAPWIAVLTKSWKLFLIVTSIPFATVPLFYFFIPESIQWLVAKQKYSQIAKSLGRIAKMNNCEIDNVELNKYIEESRKIAGAEGKTKTSSMLGLFKSPRLRKNTLILFFKSMVITLCYDAVSRNVQDKGISPFIMFSLSATTILPACLLLIVLQERIGRKAMSSLSLLTSGIFISASGIIVSNQKKTGNSTTLLVLLSIIGRFGVTVAYNSGAQYATELIPTCVRGQGVAAVHVVGYAFTFLSSYILHTRLLYSALPEIILGLMSFLGAALCLFLPETTNRKLPDSLEDGENFGKDESCFTFSCTKVSA